MLQASTIHCSSVVVACKSVTMTGSATLSTVVLSETISGDTHSTARASYRAADGAFPSGRVAAIRKVRVVMVPADPAAATEDRAERPDQGPFAAVNGRYSRWTPKAGDPC